MSAFCELCKGPLMLLGINGLFYSDIAREIQAKVKRLEGKLK